MSTQVQNPGQLVTGEPLLVVFTPSMVAVVSVLSPLVTIMPVNVSLISTPIAEPATGVQLPAAPLGEVYVVTRKPAR